MKSNRQVIEVKSPSDQAEFLKLPDKILGKPQGPEETLKAILAGSHPLCDDAKIQHFLLKQDGESLGRMTLTHYPGTDTLYLGYFHCVDSVAAAADLFEKATELAGQSGLKKIAGPMDVSFWINYRFKVSGFDDVFVGEPHQPRWYPALWEANGFRVVTQYKSNFYKVMPRDYDLTKFEARRQRIRDKGWQIRNPKPEELDRVLGEIHGLLMELYKDFPGFQKISKEDFIAIYRPMKPILDYKLVQMAYDGDRPIGFFISFPDYRQALETKSFVKKLWNLWRIKRKPDRIHLSYSGVKRGYEGLSAALYYETILELKRRQLPSVASLMQEGKVTAGFEKGLIEKQHGYHFYERWLEPENSL